MAERKNGKNKQDDNINTRGIRVCSICGAPTFAGKHVPRCQECDDNLKIRMRTRQLVKPSSYKGNEGPVPELGR